MTDTPIEQTAFGSRYHTVHKIARGGMADVYEAHDRLLDRAVALKVLFTELSTNATFVERFRREAQSAAGLSHPNIVSVYDWGSANGTYFIAMELVRGETLADFIRKSHPIAPTQAAAIGSDVALALAFAHRRGVVHRDIKPSNVLIAEDGVIKVADFGIARAASTDDNLTQTGAVLGTATYISPEQARGVELDGRTDIYSLGVVLYEMVTGVPPFTAETPLAVAYKHVTEMPMPPRELNPDVPADFETIVLKCLAKDPDQRYANAGALRSDLMRFLDAKPITAEVLAATTTVMSRPDRTQFITQQSPITSSLPVVGDEEDDSGKKSRWWVWLLVILLILALIAGGIFGIPKLVSALSKPKVPTVVYSRVPSVTGLTEQSAQSELIHHGFEVAAKSVSSSQTTGTVVSQNPSPGTREKKGSEVTLGVSNGVTYVTVPNVTGESATSAEATLVHDRFNVSTNYKADSAPQGTVLSQSPISGNRVRSGSTVVLTVSNGPSQVTVPNVVGDSVSAASNTLGKDGLGEASGSEWEYSSTVPADDVAATDPTAGTTVAPNSVVNLIQSCGPTPTTPTPTPTPNPSGPTSSTSTIMSSCPSSSSSSSSSGSS